MSSYHDDRNYDCPATALGDTIPGKCICKPAPTPEPEQSEVERLGRKIADRAAKHNVWLFEGRHTEWWTYDANGEHQHYLDLRGLLEHHPTDPNLVRVKS